MTRLRAYPCSESILGGEESRTIGLLPIVRVLFPFVGLILPIVARAIPSGGRGYSGRSALMTSTRAARAAGVNEAKIAAVTRIAAAPSTVGTPGILMSGM
jgi:hypothetical protein